MFKLLAEFIGSFIFFFVILQHGKALEIAVALAAMIFAFAAVSGANFNPAVSFSLFLSGKLSSTDFISYVLVQLLAGALAVYAVRHLPSLKAL